MLFKCETSDQMSFAEPRQRLNSRSMVSLTRCTYECNMGSVKHTVTTEITEKATVE